MGYAPMVFRLAPAFIEHNIQDTVCTAILQEVEGMVSLERQLFSRGSSHVVEFTMGRMRDWSV